MIFIIFRGFFILFSFFKLNVNIKSDLKFCKLQDDGSGSDDSDMGSDSENLDEDKADKEGAQSTVDEEDDEAEWEKLQKKMNK